MQVMQCCLSVGTREDARCHLNNLIDMSLAVQEWCATAYMAQEMP